MARKFRHVALGGVFRQVGLTHFRQVKAVRILHMVVFRVLMGFVDVEKYVVPRAVLQTDAAGARIEWQRYGEKQVMGAG
jgi:hypothetical protein